ncbi:hypothetical protein Clacol_001221 [Clathrus columnatus]|uniref:Ricin B lectin domain-containing protein n=1 Tax=Clathrus columnatus TaxID=1419009 RepID=A0AAV5A0N4_9AGAM|nr:hypothetical protein Clacol_001221 [Clathrus columnatus]
MSIVHLQPSTYTIESVKYPGVVFDLKGSTIDTPWSLQYIDEASNTFILQAASPSSNIFTAKIIEGADTVGTPYEETPLQVRAYGPASQYQIIPASQPDLALQAPNSGDGQIKLEVSNSSAPEQQWIFNNLD